MRFELGDTHVDGGVESCVLADEEYYALLEDLKPGLKSWLTMKLTIIEAIQFKMSFQVDTKIDVLAYANGARADRWQMLYEKTRRQLLANIGMPTIAGSAVRKPPYFYTGMDDNKRADRNTTAIE
jgi:hypothetical protein